MDLVLYVNMLSNYGVSDIPTQCFSMFNILWFSL